MKKKLNIDAKLEKQLDEALEATFPCSDPVSINQSVSVSTGNLSKSKRQPRHRLSKEMAPEDADA